MNNQNFSEEKPANLYREIKIKKLIEKFGREILEIKGFADFLYEQTNDILDVKVDVKWSIGICLIEKHWLENRINLGMSSEILCFKNGSVIKKEFQFKCPNSGGIDDSSLEFGAIKLEHVDENFVKIIAIPKSLNFAPTSILFENK